MPEPQLSCPLPRPDNATKNTQDDERRARILALQRIKVSLGNGEFVIRNNSVNVDHDRKLYFIHNPKAMGISMKAWLGLPIKSTQHNFPTLSVSPDWWEEYTTVLVVRDPVQRFLSSFQFHCRSAYTGKYLKSYPDLKTLDPTTYFHRMVQREPLLLAPQWKWSVHLSSNMPVDVLIKMGEHEAPLRRLAARFGLVWPMPRINQTTSKKVALSDQLRAEIMEFYSRDYDEFGFSRDVAQARWREPFPTGEGLIAAR